MNRLTPTPYDNIWNYKNQTITKWKEGFWTVVIDFTNEEAVFDTLDEAIHFVDTEVYNEHYCT